MPRLTSITSQALTGIALIKTAEAAYSIALTQTDNVNSIGNTLYNGETATLTITAVNNTVASPGSFVAPVLYWSINATTSEFTSVSGTVSSTLDSHDGNTTMTSTYSLDITAASSIAGEGLQTIVLREGAVNGPVAETYAVSIENFIPPPGNWTDDNGDPVTVRTIIGGFSMQVDGVFAVSPGVPFVVQGAITGTQTTITSVTANTGSVLELNDSGNSTSFQVGEQLDIIAIEYTITPASSSVNEGGAALAISIGTTSLPNGSVFYWTLSEPDQFDTSQGQFTINNNSAIVEVNAPIADATTEGTQTFTFNIRTGSATGPIRATSDPITINDTSLTPTYAAVAVANSISEGNALIINVATTNVLDASSLWWTIPSANASDFTTSSGSFVISSNAGSFTVTPDRDTTTEGEETFQVQIRTDGTDGTIVATTNTITIIDSSTDPLYIVSLDADTYNEGDTVTVNLQTARVSDGTTVDYFISGVAASDVSKTTGTLTISDNFASDTFTIVEDATTEGPEDVVISLAATDSAGFGTDGTGNTTSISATITDTSIQLDYIDSPALILRIDPSEYDNIGSMTNLVTDAAITSGGNLPVLADAGNVYVTSGNKAIEFTYDGTSEAAAAASAESLIPDIELNNAVCTVQVWVHPDRTSAYTPNYTGRATIFGAVPPTNSFAFDSLWISGTSPYRVFGETSTNNNNYASIQSAIVGETWNCITIVGTGGQNFTTYINGGSLSGGSENTRTGIPGNIEYGSIGAPQINFFGGDNYEVPFSGYIGHVLWYTENLTAQQVSDMYELQKSRYTIRSGT